MCRLYFSQVKVIVLPGVFGYSVIHIYSGNDSGKAGELSTSGCPSVNHLFICPEWERFCYANKERSPSENVMTDVVDAFVCSRSKIIRGTSYRRRGWNDLTGQVLNHPS